MHLGLKERAIYKPLSVSPRHLQMSSTSDDVWDLFQRKVELWARNGRSNWAYNATSTAIVGVFYMPQSCDTALLPLRRKAYWEFFARKIRRLRPVLNPRTWVPEASMLTTRPPKPLFGGLSHTSRFAAVYLLSIVNKSYSPHSYTTIIPDC
jgi:hypothetical protein